MNDTSRSTGWRNVDESESKEVHVKYLDRVRMVEEARRYKELSISLLNLKRGVSALDVGCGTGEDVLFIGNIVGPEGRAIGVDISETMISEARKRIADQHLTNVEFADMDAESLDFADESFEGCRADRVLQHLENPKKALGEIFRVTKRNGRIVVADTDWDTLTVDSDFKEITRKVIHAGTDETANGWSGRQLYGMFKSLGLANARVEPLAGAFTNYSLANQVLNLDSYAILAETKGLITTEEKTRWVSDLQKKQGLGRFLASLTVFVVDATKC